jgi:hypothetical protein
MIGAAMLGTHHHEGGRWEWGLLQAFSIFEYVLGKNKGKNKKRYINVLYGQ